jgi:transglutaminase/protease-like cytokinesis protein 3
MLRRFSPGNTPTLHGSVCAGYADLFCQMCDCAGVPVRKISGIAKGYGYQVDGRIESKPNHDWNAVRIGGTWYLVDATWDSGHIDDSRSFRKEYRTDYLFLAPEAFIYTHFPLGESDQLLSRPISMDEFARMPWLRGGSFSNTS